MRSTPFRSFVSSATADSIERINPMFRFLSAALLLLSSSAGAADIPGWFLSGGGRKSYESVIDKEIKHSGKSSALLQPGPKAAGYGTLMQAFTPSNLLGKRVRLSAWIRTEGTTGRVDFWSRVQGPASPADGEGLGGAHYNLPEKSEWTRYDMVFDVHGQAISFQFGIGLDGPGKVWIDDVRIEEVPKTTPIEDGHRHEPENLDFEK